MCPDVDGAFERGLHGPVNGLLLGLQFRLQFRLQYRLRPVFEWIMQHGRLPTTLPWLW